jgi:hypothetical protein
LNAAATAAPAITALVLIFLMAVGPDLYDLIDTMVALNHDRRRGQHHPKKVRPEVRVTPWSTMHPHVRESAPQICDGSEVAKVALDGMMVWPPVVDDDPLKEPENVA